MKRSVLLGVFLIVLGFLSPGNRGAQTIDESVNIGVLENWPPQYLTDPETGKPGGFAIDMMQLLVEKTGIKIQYKSYPTWQLLIEGARNGDVDIIPNMGITENRLQDFLFTSPYETFRVRIFIRSTSTGIEDIADLKEKNIGVVFANIGVTLVDRLEIGYVKLFDSLEAAFFALLAGTIDALIYPDEPINKIAAQSGLQDRIRPIGGPLIEVKRGIAIVKNKTDLYVLINSALREILESEDYSQIYGKWYHAPTPYWTATRVSIVMGFVLGITVIILVVWRFYSLVKVNRELQSMILEKETVEKALVKSETNFRQIAENIKEVFWVVTIDWKRVEYISPAYEEVWGKSCKSLYENPLSWMDALPHEDRLNVGNYLAEKQQGELDNIIFPEYRVLRDDGSERWIFARGFPIRNEQGEIYRVAGIAEDITERKKSREELQASEEQVRLLLDHSGEGIYGIDLNGKCIFANPASVKILGYQSPEDLIGKNIHYLVHHSKEDKTELPESDCNIYKALTKGEETFGDDETFWRANGTPFPVEYNSAPMKRGEKLIGAVVNFVDITDRKRAEEQLKQVNDQLEHRVAERTAELAKLHSAVEQSPNVVVITDADGVIEYVNPKFCATYGYSTEEAVGQKTSILKADNVTRDEFQVLWDQIKAGKEWRGELHNLKKNGERIWQLVSISPVKNVDNIITHFIASQENIDLEKQAEFKLQKAMIAAEKANQTKSTFLANMSHELRTPLNAIIGFTQLLEHKNHGELTDKQRRFFNRIKEAGDHLLQMVNDVLDLSKVEAGKIELEKRPFDFGKMLIRSPLTIQSLASKKSIRIVQEIPEDIGWLEGDETRIKQVLFNLLSNAFKFTPEGKQIGIKATPVKSSVIIVVWDEGIGIKPEDQEKIFDPFEQIGSANKVQQGGTGLGLAISRKLIELHGGTLEVSSKFGEGSQFMITLPGRVDNDETNTPNSDFLAKSMEQSDRSNLKILVVEDNEANRHLIGAALRMFQYQLKFAKTGEEAVKKALSEPFDLILMDIQLPGKTGSEAMQEIKSTLRQKIPIIAVTAFAMKGDRQKYLDEGFDAYVSKPISIDELQKAIENAMKEGQTSQSVPTQE